MEILKGSFLFKILLKLADLYKNSFFSSLLDYFSQKYEDSFLKPRIDLWLLKKSSVDESFYNKILISMHKFVARVGQKFMLYWYTSVAYTATTAVYNFSYTLCTKSSFLSKFTKWLAMSRFIFICLGLYFPIDYLLRNIISINILASTWDELLMIFAIGVIKLRYMDEAYKNPSSIENIKARSTPLDASLILFIAVSTFLMFTSTDYFSIAFAGYRVVVQYMLWFFIAVRLAKDDEDVKAFFYALCISGALIGLHGIYQYIVGVPIPAQWVTHSEAGVRTRVFSIIGSPNVMGSFLILVSPMVLSVAYYAKNLWLKLSCWGLTFCMGLSLLFTFSRGAWGGFAITVIVFSIMIDKRILALMVAACTVVLFAVPSIANRITFLFTSDFAEASQIGGRALRWEVGRQMLAENPVIGVGLGRFGGAVAMQNKILDETETFQYFYMDNYYLKLAVEMGYMGVIAYIILIFFLIIWSVRAISHIKDNTSFLIKGAFAGMIGVLVHCYFENIFEVPAMSTYFWVLSALIIYFGFVRTKSPN